MTTAAESTLSEKEQKKAEREANAARDKEMRAREEKLNEGKTGKGLRLFLGMTRGRNPQEIQFEQWDDSLPETLPTTLSEFMDLRKVTEEKDIMRRLILGDNDILYSEASDPVAEFQEAAWSEDFQKSFRLVINNYVKNTGVSVEDAVAIIKPGMVAGFAKLQAEKK